MKQQQPKPLNGAVDTSEEIYREGICWYGDPMPKSGHQQTTFMRQPGICAVPGCPRYRVEKSSIGGLGAGSHTFMYLCNDHVDVLKHMGFTLTKVV